MSLAPWHRHVVNTTPGTQYMRQVWAATCMDRFGDQAALADVILHLSGPPRAAPLVAQIALFLGDALDLAITQLLIGKGHTRRARFAHDGLLSKLAKREALGRDLVRYVVSTRDAPADRQHWSLATDKGECGRMDLQLSVIVWGNNLAAIAIPQVVCF